MDSSQYLQWTWWLLMINLLFNLIGLLGKDTRDWIEIARKLTLVLGLLGLIGLITVRSLEAEYFAWTNMFESIIMVCIGLFLSYLALAVKLRSYWLEVFLSISLLSALGFASTLDQSINALQPALASYWRVIHVPIILLSYALLTLSFLSSLLYLGTRWLKPEKERLLNLYDEWTYRSISLGFPLLALGIVLGALWANEAWGVYWNWDPKETTSLATLLGYGVYLHLRLLSDVHPSTLSAVSVGAFLLLLVTYFGVNLLGVGLHSYGNF